jgi:hypothetical protein
MAALDFPSSPTDGQVYNNWIYSSAKGAWKSKPLTAAKTVNSDTPPSNPANGDQWFNTVDSTLYIYYTDADTSQWVESRAPIISDGYYSPNYIINGGMEINQRNSSAASGTDRYSLDRWYISFYGSGQPGSVTQLSGSTPTGLYNYLEVQQTSANSSNYFLVQPIETLMTAPLAGQTVTLSFWYKMPTNFTGAWTAFIRSSTTVDATVGTFISGTSTTVGSLTLTNTTTWTRGTITVVVPSTANTLGIGFQTTNSVVNGAKFDVTGVQLEVGSVATPFRRNANSLQGELAACQRYFQVAQMSARGYGTVALIDTGACGFYTYPVQFRANPTLTQTSVTLEGSPSGYDSYFDTSTKYGASYLYRHGNASGSGGLKFTVSWTASAEL